MLTGFKIEGRCFEEPEHLAFFPVPNKQQPQARASVVYGRNGTGKSTISAALAQLQYATLNSIEPDAVSNKSWMSSEDDSTTHRKLAIAPTFVQPNGVPEINIPPVRTAVFNENYIEQNVKFREDGLETVVLFGDQEEIETELVDTQKRLAIRTTEITENEYALKIANNSEEATFKDLQTGLRDGWAKRQQRIRRNTGSTPVNKEVIERFLALGDAPDDGPALLHELEERISSYLETTDATLPVRVWEQLVDRSFLGGMEKDLLERTIEPPTGEGIARIVGENLTRFGTYVHQANELFKDTSVSHCPMCQQSLSPQYRSELLSAIAGAIDDEAEKFTELLEQAKLRPVAAPDGPFEARLEAAATQFETARTAYNLRAREWNEACDRKKENLYSSIEWNTEPLHRAAQELADSVFALETRYSQIVDAIAARNTEKSALEALNRNATRWEVNAQLQAHSSSLRAVRELQNARQALDQEVTECQLMIADLVAQSQNVHIAAEEINMGLRAIFAEAERLKLVLDTSSENGSRYFLHNRGRSVSPSNLSVGERNIVALTYFFTTVRRELEELTRATREDWFLVALDDPVSSVDIDNRLGIHGFIEAQLRTLLGHEHKKLKVLLLSHDLSVARQMEKSAVSALFALEVSANSNFSLSKVKSRLVSRFELSSEHKLLAVSTALTDLNEYQALIKQAWRFANNQVDAASPEHLSIGNVTRRILEAFSTFIYDESSIPSGSMIAEYERITDGRELVVDLGPGHRLFLHESSHSSDRLTALSDFGGFSGLSANEQVVHVQKVFAFMYVLQPTHVTLFVPETREMAHEVLKAWCVEQLGHSA